MEVLTETVKVVVEKIVDYTITAVGRQMGYLISYKKNVDKLRNEVVDLEDDRKSVERKVEDARNNVEEIEDKVLTWLKRVETVTEEAQEFFKEEGQAKLKCFNGRCLNLKARYQLGKRAHKMGLAIMEIKEKGTFPTVGHRVPIQGGTTISTKGYEDFESRKSTLNGIMRALKDDSIRAIGVYGMGGVGKTMLVGKIATQAKEDKLFESIVKVVVSQTPDLEKIQKDIAKELGLSFQDETDSQKAHLLRERLKKGNILLIIDDIWNKIDLESRGISFGDDKKGSKLLLTSRFRDVLGTDMDTQEIFSVGVLSDGEAKYLFSKIVGDLDENLNFQSIMVELVQECAGLPIAITTVANALKSQKDPSVWKDAVRQLKRANPTQIKDMHKMVYSSIKLSYDFLTKEAQSLFLFCSIFEEDEDIEIDLLSRYLVGLDFFQDVYTMEEVRNMVHTLVERLKDSCLLLEGYESDTFKMHDVIRDVAIYIADKEEKMLTIRSSSPEPWLNMEKWKGSSGIALFDDFKELPERFGCPQLKFIFLSNKRTFWPPIPNNVFEGMKELRVLVLISASLPHLSSISCLHNLQSLALSGCELEDVALIGELKNLRALTLSRSNIKELPMEIRQLTHLQLLDLNYCTKLEVIPSNVFSGLRKLEELYMNDSFNQWHVDGEITERNNTRVSELDHLPLLTTLYIHIPNPKILPKALLFENLKRYEILIGNDEDEDEDEDVGWDSDNEDEDEDEDEDVGWDSDNDDDEFKILRTLKLKLDRGLQIEDGIKVLLKSCEFLELTPSEGIKNIFYEADKEVFSQLKRLYVQNGAEIQYIVNFMEFQCAAFPVLKSLSLDNMKNLEEICHDQVTMGSFLSLKKLRVKKCEKLTFVSSLTMFGCFLQLQEIVIKDCKVMRAIFSKEGTHEMQVNHDTNIIDFTQLRSLYLRNLPNLVGFHPDADSQLLFNEKVAFSNLEEIYIKGIDNLKMLWHNHQLVPDSFCKIKKLHVGSCKNLMNIFPLNMLRRLQNLEELTIEDCNLVEEVFEIREENFDEICDNRSTQLRHLTLNNLPKLKHVWTSDPEAILKFQNLRQVKVSKCETLKSLFPISVAKHLEQLESLKIYDCELMEEIVALKEGLESMTKFVFPQITSLSLEFLLELKCFYRGKHTSEWPSLKELTIHKCDKVKIVDSNELSFSNKDGLGHHVLVQQPLFCTEKVAFSNLEDMDINNMDNLKMLWHNHQLVPDSICKLKKLHVFGCKNLINIFPPNMLRRLQNLEELEIRDCNSIEEVFDIKGANVDEICDTASTRLRVLRLLNLPKLEHVWSSDPQANLTFQNLCEVEVSNCKSLKSFFPILVAKSREQLESLTIGNCGLEEIVAMEEGVEITIKFLFPRITSLYLESLPELKYFYPGKHTLEWPLLKTLRINNCNKVKITASNELSFQERDELVHHDQVQQPLFPIEKVAFSNLEDMDISDIDNLKMLWHDHQLVLDSFCKLKKLHVFGCKHLTNIFPLNMLRRLQNLEELEIRNCNSIEEVFDIRGANVDEICDTVSARLRVLRLFNLPKLEHVWSSVPQANLTFQNLCEVEVSNCKSLKSFFPILVAKSRVQLESLTIGNCGLEEIVAMEAGMEITINFLFPRITSLYLESLPEIKYFYPGKHTLEWPSLKWLRINNCNKVKIIASNELSFQERDELVHHDQVQQPLFPIEKVAFSNLEYMDISDMDNLKMLWHNHQLVLDSFCKLKKLHVFGCKHLINIFPLNMLRRLQNLEELEIRDCNSIEEVFDIRGANVDEICDTVFTRLRVLRLFNLSKLEHVWSSIPQANLTFQNLCEVEVSNCKSLKSFFPILVAKSREQFESLTIGNCGLEEIVAMEAGMEITIKFLFPRITSLYLESLPELKYFYPGKHTLEWPSLKRLRINNCNQVKIIASNELSSQERDELVHHDQVQQPLFPIETVSFSNLEDMDISDMDNLKTLWHDHQLVLDSFCKLKKLHVFGCKHLSNIFPLNMLRRLQNLEELEMRDCNSIEEVFDIRGANVDEICDTVSTRLRVLRLFNLPKLEHVWSSVPQAILTFQNLCKVKVSNCKSLKSFFPILVAKSREQLESLTIGNCGLEEIVAMEAGMEITIKFLFPRITSLYLKSLPEFKYFYPGKHTLEWPSLKRLRIKNCNKVKIIASNELSFQERDELVHHDQVLQSLFPIETVAFSNLKDMDISDMDNLKMLWHDPQLVLDPFCKLKKLHVFGCKHLINIFPLNMLRRLQNLEELEIRDCNSIEEVFDIRGENVDEICDTVSTRLRVLRLFNLPKLEHVWSSVPQAILTFQNLCKVKVSNCKSLKSFFPILVAKSCEQLESLTIGNCGLEEIVAMEAGMEITIKFLFPRITSLYLKSLPELKYFYPGKHTLEWPSLKKLRINNCNKVKIIASNELSFQERDELVDHDQVQQPLFLIEKDTLSNIEELKLDWDDTINQTYDRLKAQFSCKLKVLGLYSKDRSTAFPWVFVQGLHNLKELDISNFFLEEICPCGIVDNEGKYAEVFERLTTLHLSKMPKLMHLWKENSEQGMGIQNLESLHVSECGRLKNLVPSSMYFQNLNTLNVWNCHGLISLATSSTVKSLVQLKSLTISECKRMREMVTSEGEGEAGDEICFNQLDYLSLYDLPTLRSFFHLGNRTMKFPSLYSLFVDKCPELKNFSNEVLSMRKLDSFGLDGNYWSKYRKDPLITFIKRCWENNNDPCLRQLFTQKTNAGTSEATEENDVDDLEDDSM